MPADENFLDGVLKMLAPLQGVTNKPMFGGYGIFKDTRMFALIKGNGLFFKVDDSNRADYEAAGRKQYKPMPYYQVPDEVLGNTGKLLSWAKASVQVANAAPSKPAKKK